MFFHNNFFLIRKFALAKLKKKKKQMCTCGTPKEREAPPVI
jgi:hypothetical protein